MLLRGRRTAIFEGFRIGNIRIIFRDFLKTIFISLDVCDQRFENFGNFKRFHKNMKMKNARRSFSRVSILFYVLKYLFKIVIGT